MATGVQAWSKTAATNATADSNVNWSEGQAPSSINDSARAEMASVAKWRDDISGTITTGGSSTAYTVTTNQGFASAAAMSGAQICFIPHTTSGASPTLAVDGLTARAINKSTGVAVASGALVAGTPYIVTYIHASTEFILRGYIETFPNPTATGQFKAADGTKTAPGYSFTSDLDTGIYRIGANNLGISCGDTKIFDITTSGVSITGTHSISGTSGHTGKATFSGLANFASAAYASTTAGDIEYDGKAFANIPVASDRGISPSVHFLSISADQTGNNDTNDQTWFPGGGATQYTAAASTAFFFDGLLMMTRAAGTTAHVIIVSIGGTATFTQLRWHQEGTATTGNALTAVSARRMDDSNVVTGNSITASNTSATENNLIRVRGIMRVNGGGTIKPQFRYDVAPGGVPTIKGGSYFRIWPVGIDTVLNVGNWS